MEIFKNIKENAIADYATLKIKSGVDNKFFDFNIKNMEDQVILLDLLDKTSKSFFNLEKSFVSFLETGESNFSITKNRVDWVNDEASRYKQGMKKADYTIKCKVSFPIGKSYLGFITLLNNENNTINNYIKSAEVYSQGINTKLAQSVIIDSINNLRTIVEDLEKSQDKKDDYLDQVYNDFKNQLVNVFYEAISIRSNRLLNADTLRDRINTSLTNVSEGEIKDGFYDKLDNARLNFLNMNKDIIESFLTSNEDIVNDLKDKIGSDTKEGKKDQEATVNVKEFFAKGDEKLRRAIIINERNLSTRKYTKIPEDLNETDTEEQDID